MAPARRDDAGGGHCVGHPRANRRVTIAFWPGKSAEGGRQILGAYRGVAVVDGYAVSEVLARAGPDLTLAPLLDAHAPQVPRDRRPVAHGVRGDLHAHRGALCDRAPSPGPVSR